MQRSDRSSERPSTLSPMRFGDIEVDTRARTLTRAGVAYPVEPKAFDVLCILVDRPNEVVTREDLLDQVWNHRFVSPRSLTRLVAQLRHAMADDAADPQYIRTRHSLGYCFIGDLQGSPSARPAVVAERSVAAGPRDRRDRRSRTERRESGATLAVARGDPSRAAAAVPSSHKTALAPLAGAAKREQRRPPATRPRPLPGTAA